LLKCVDVDQRLRGSLRFHASSTGRWSGSRFQPQNLKKPETRDLDAAVDAIMSGDMMRIRELGAPLMVAGDIARGIICAAPGHVLIGADFSAIESRMLAWLAGEKWKLDTYRQYDETRDPALEPYCVMASKALRRTVTPDDEAGRGFGKVYDLAFGFGGGVGAWRKFDTSDTYSDAEIEDFKRAFRAMHPATFRFWHRLERHAHRCVRTKKPTALGNIIAFDMDGSTLFMRLPSGLFGLSGSLPCTGQVRRHPGAALQGQCQGRLERRRFLVWHAGRECRAGDRTRLVGRGHASPRSGRLQDRPHRA
jgi:DNA polymerase